MFQSSNDMPIKFDAARLNAGSAIQTLQANKGKYYQSCRKLFSTQTLEQDRKKSANSKEAENIESSSKPMRVSIDYKCSACFLCEQQFAPSELRQAMTMKLNKQINEYAEILNNGRLFHSHSQYW